MYPKEMFIKKEKKELIIFLAVAYGLPFLMAIPMGILFYVGKEVASFPFAQMFYPAAGLMLAKLICEKENPLLPKNFFISFLGLTGVMVLWCFTGFFLPDGIAVAGSEYLTIIGTVILACVYFSEEKEKRSAYGLTGKNWGLSVLLLALFVILTCVGAFVAEGLSGMRGFLLGGLDQQLLISLPLLFVFTASSFLGEEYGWRTYFQPLLQKKFGLIKGTLLFGVLWEFWHLPLVFFYYSPKDPSMSLGQWIVFRYFGVTLLAIFMAYAYMKTHNVWLPVLIHFVNNALAGTGIGIEAVTWTMLGILILIKVATYLPFLLSQVFRRQTRNEIEQRKVE